MGTTAANIAAAADKFLNGDNSKKKEDEKIQPKDFFWDQLITYFSGAILAVSLANVSIEFLFGRGVSCFPPSLFVGDNDGSGGFDTVLEVTRVQADYINDYCTESLPRTEYFPFYMILHATLLVAPQYLWSVLFKADLDSFFASVEKLDRSRDPKTGEFDPKNVHRVNKLEIEYGGTRSTMFIGYISKLILQLLVSLSAIAFSRVFFTNFSPVFECPTTFDSPNRDLSPAGETNWPFNTTVSCVYTVLRLLGITQYFDHLLSLLSIFTVFGGLIWCFTRHTKELGAKDVAKFVYSSCLTPDTFSYHKWYNWFTPIKCCSCCCYCCYCTICYPNVTRLKYLFHPRIKSDIDFLLMWLFRADCSLGRVFRKIQVEKGLNLWKGIKQQRLHCVINMQIHTGEQQQGQKLQNDQWLCQVLLNYKS